jgi:SAM-dependent methyltransferase
LPDACRRASSDDQEVTTSTEPSESSESSESFQIPIEAAEAYEATFVPAFFAQWAPAVCAAAGVVAGDRVLDVACGTGIVARTAADIVGAANVVGVDLNEAMLTVARRVRPDIDWREGDVAALPFADSSFDAVVCQMALMFFPDRVGAIREMGRVTTSEGSVVVLVPGDLDEQPAYGPLVDVVTRHAGPEARSLFSTYFACGDTDRLVAQFTEAGLRVTSSATRHGTARFPSVDAAMAAEVESTPLGERITPEVYERILADARQLLRPFTASDGRLEAPFDSSIVVARRP